jgi:hypothetical protein
MTNQKIKLVWQRAGVYESENAFVLHSDNKDKFPFILPKSLLIEKALDKHNDHWLFIFDRGVIGKQFDSELPKHLKNVYGSPEGKLQNSVRCVEFAII